MISMSAEPEKVVRILNSLLRSEISATESYTQAIPRFASDVEVLREIAREHGQAVTELRAAIQSVGGTPDQSSGVFPALLPRVVNGPAQVFGEAAALKVLKDVEERGLDEYQDAIQRLNGSGSSWISDTQIPAQIKHISSIDSLIARL